MDEIKNLSFELTTKTRPFLCLPADCIKQHPEIYALICGAVVCRQGPNCIETLIIRRVPSDTYPMLWEHSARSLDIDTDTSIVHCAVRELLEETGLKAIRVLCPVGMSLAEQSTQLEEDARMAADGILLTFRTSRHTWGKITFLIEVEDGEIRLDPHEHDDYAWVTGEQVRHNRIDARPDYQVRFVSEAVKATLLEGFRTRAVLSRA